MRDIKMRIKVKTDRHGLPLWLLWSHRIIAFKLYFCSHKCVMDFPFCLYLYSQKKMIHCFLSELPKSLWFVINELFFIK